jgi:hypothetical protein
MKNTIAKIIEYANKLDENGQYNSADKLIKMAQGFVHHNWDAEYSDWTTEHVDQLRSSIRLEIPPKVREDMESFEEMIPTLAYSIDILRTKNDIDGYHKFRKKAEQILDADWRGPFPPYKELWHQIIQLLTEISLYENN